MMLGQALRDQQRELVVFRNRLLLAGFGILAAFGILATRFAWLQVVQKDHYHTLAEANRISVVPVVPNRGIITDRNGEILAANFSAYTLEITPGRVANVERAIDELAEVIEVTPRDRRRFRKLQEESKNFESLPIRTRLSEEEVARFAVNRFRFPGFEIKARLFRSYPQGEVASHAIGYIGRINEPDVKRIEAQGLATNYKGTDHIGKLGLEGAYEKELHGLTGSEQVEIDAGGRAIRALSRNEPISGNNLQVTLDLQLQKVAEEAFQDYRGALVAIDPKTGDVLALVSKPGFDPNLFVDGIDPVNWDALNNSPDKPLNNRALRGQYPPGSTIKPFLALAALEYKKRTPEFAISDPGFFTLPGVAHRYRDHKVGGHGSVNLHKAVVVSCDTYFYGLSNDLGIDNIHRFMTQFGFGARTGIDIEGELTGIQPSTEWKWQRFKQKWYSGDTISVGIGQGYWLTTPMQLAAATATLANDGVVVHPRLLKAVQDSKTQEVKALHQPMGERLPFKPEHLALIKNAMIDVTKPGGTAARAGAGAPYTIAAKTGTAQVIGMKQGEKYDEKKVKEVHRDHAIFIAYAPAEDPKIALALLVENGGHGGSTAAPIAREVFDFHLLGKRPAKRQKLGDDEPGEVPPPPQ
ncbi:penicillin-binding protein 2 [Usitatibacter palustris]|uniref:Peptidoglycan D,D-transpeptidase MrdA n=1 Tax=Usitatibacter palustris TaxID=2732487 RepID=A0A6M4HB94_9PROT|nr:penicillin-binding protein 2 [Usitatibacter palustris]QJR16841.1 Peptidoglycan D,D-transpeptidase MrdA [Usitatibacter palustris]